jgi:hypothetical protein
MVNLDRVTVFSTGGRTFDGRLAAARDTFSADQGDAKGPALRCYSIAEAVHLR